MSPLILQLVVASISTVLFACALSIWQDCLVMLVKGQFWSCFSAFGAPTPSGDLNLLRGNLSFSVFPRGTLWDKNKVTKTKIFYAFFFVSVVCSCFVARTGRVTSNRLPYLVRKNNYLLDLSQHNITADQWAQLVEQRTSCCRSCVGSNSLSLTEEKVVPL